MGAEDLGHFQDTLRSTLYVGRVVRPLMLHPLFSEQTECLKATVDKALSFTAIATHFMLMGFGNAICISNL